MDRIDPIRNFRFRLEFDGVVEAAFSEVAIAESTIDAVDYREGQDPPHVRKLSGLTKYGNITLKRGITVGTSALFLFNWFNEVSRGDVLKKRKTVTINVLNEIGKEAARFVVSMAWPVKYDPSDLNAKGNEVMIEHFELCHEGIERLA